MNNFHHNDQEPRPPKWPLRFLRRICPEHLYEEIEGDLIQKFHRDLRQASAQPKWSDDYQLRRAKQRFIWNTLRFFRPGILFRNKLSYNFYPFYMLSHFFRIFFRTSMKNSGYAFINVSGLAVGLACAILIMLWVLDEIAFDDFHHGRERIFKVMVNHDFQDDIKTYDYTPGPLASGLKQLPEVEAACRMTFANNLLFEYSDNSIFESGVYADTSIFKIFTIPVIAGDHNHPLKDNNSVVISETLAHKYFNDEEPIGKIFRVNNNLDVKVTAVFHDLPHNSSLKFDYILPYEIYAKTDPYNNEWGAWSGGQSYVKLHERADLKTLTDKIHKNFTKPNIWERWDSNVELFLFPMPSWRLYENFNNGKQEGGRITYVITFVIVGIFILLIACVNFINLATARSMSRAREIGVRKVVGANRQSLIRQFMAESIVTAFIALFFALLAVHLLLPSFNSLTEKHLEIDYTNPLIFSALAGVTFIAGLMAGSYPAFLLSSFRPVNVLKGTLAGLGGEKFRKALVVFQFAISVILIVCALVVYQQIDFMRDKNIGFDRSNVFYFNSTESLEKNFSGFRNAALQDPLVEKVGRSSQNPMDVNSGIVLNDDAWPGKSKEDNTLFMFIKCDYDLLSALGFTFVDGRNFSAEFPADSANYVINEEAARRMKLTDPVGQELNAPEKGKIIGVVKDFHSANFRIPIAPVIIAMRPDNADRIFIRYKPGQLSEAIKSVEAVYSKFEPDFPFEPGFLDETFERQYKSELLAGRLSGYFTAIAIFISCLGLFGLGSFTAEKRTKEIGLRKVMGATVTELISLLCKDFIQLIAMALVIGLPIAWWAAQQFLDRYQFHTDTGYEIFLITAFSMFLIAMLSVSYQSARAALTNPVKSLRSE